MKIVFMGTPEFAVPCLKKIYNDKHDIIGVVTQPDKPKGRGRKISHSPIKKFALENDLTIFQPINVKDGEFIEIIEKLNPDIIIVVAFGQIIPEAILKIPKYGCINVHASLLPKLRGAAPINWAIINGDKKSGITTMQMDKGLDTGDILIKEEVQITENMTASELYNSLMGLEGIIIEKTLEGLELGNIKPISQDNSKATWAPKMTKVTGELNWEETNTNVHNLIRGTYPWPGGYTFFDNKRMKIFSSKISCCEKEGTPGEILDIMKDHIIIACGSGCIEVFEIQFENCARMGIDKCGHNIIKGSILGKKV